MLWFDVKSISNVHTMYCIVFSLLYSHLYSQTSIHMRLDCKHIMHVILLLLVFVDPLCIHSNSNTIYICICKQSNTIVPKKYKDVFDLFIFTSFVYLLQRIVSISVLFIKLLTVSVKTIIYAFTLWEALFSAHRGMSRKMYYVFTTSREQKYR